jgi:sugar phosphate isomerase/epimerase
MNLMLCMSGQPDQLRFLPEIAELGAGIELESYGMVGIQSERHWETRFTLHKAVCAQFQGTIAVHGPFIGMEYTHTDHLIRDVVARRMDMIFDVAMELKARRVVLHSGYAAAIDLFGLHAEWLERSIKFWQHEIRRWADARTVIVLENDVQKSPDLLIRLVDEVNNPFLGLCMDIGHQHLFSELDAVGWVRRMGFRLFHVHLHDNDRSGDHHWSIGRGTIEFGPFYAAIARYAPGATVSLEVEETMDVKMSDLRKLAGYFGSKGHSIGASS